MAGITPSQTVGPFFAPALTPGKEYPWHQPIGNDLITPDASGERIRIEGRVLDGDGAPVSDAMIEIWQADAAGRYAHPADKQRPNAKFTGFGRAGTDAEGRFSFRTIKPGAVAGPDGKPQAPHILVAVFARGLPRHAYTRIYFSDEAGNCGRSDPCAGPARSPQYVDRATRGKRRTGRLCLRHQAAGRERDSVF